MNASTLLEVHGSSQRLRAMTPAERQAAAEAGELSLHELNTWASHFPEEVPLVNGELPWIALAMADLD